MSEHTPLETWKDINGYVGLYKISANGQVKSFVKYKDGKILKPSFNHGGYLLIGLNIPKNQTFSVHKLVAQAFLGDKPKGMEINHKDGNKTNNHYSNLEYVTRSQNIVHSFNNGRPRPSGSKNHNAILTEEKVLKMRQLRAVDKKSIKDLCSIFNVKFQTAYGIISGKSWKHVN